MKDIVKATKEQLDATESRATKRVEQEVTVPSAADVVLEISDSGAGGDPPFALQVVATDAVSGERRTWSQKSALTDEEADILWTLRKRCAAGWAQ